MGIKLLESRFLERNLQSVLDTKTVRNRRNENVIMTNIQNGLAKEELSEKTKPLDIFYLIGFKICNEIIDLQRFSVNELLKTLKNCKCLSNVSEKNDRWAAETKKQLQNLNLTSVYSLSDDKVLPDQFKYFMDYFILDMVKEFAKVFKVANIYQKVIVTGAIHGLVCRMENIGIQMLSPLFSKLHFGCEDLLSPTPEKFNRHRVKGTLPPDNEKELVQNPSSLLFVVLGWSGNIPTVTIEAYLPQANRWFYVPQNIYVERAYHGVVILGILIYVIGGFDGRKCYNTTFCFNIQKRRWYRRATMNKHRCYVTTLTFRGMVYALGGFDGYGRLKSCERFDPLTRQWELISSMNVRRSDASGTAHNGKVYVCGGYNGVRVLRSVEMYDPEEDQWTFISNMLGPRSGQVLISHQGELLVIGGFNGEMRLRSVERFDEEKCIWVQHIPLLSARSNFAAVVLEDQLHVIGGYDGESTFGEVERFNDHLKKWEKLQTLIKHRSAHGACVFKDSMTVSMCSTPGHITVQSLNMQQPSP